MTDETLQYVRMRGTRNGAIYCVVDDKTVDGVRRLVLLTVDGNSVGHYSEAYPEEVEPLERPRRYDMGSTAGPAD